MAVTTCIWLLCVGALLAALLPIGAALLAKVFMQELYWMEEGDE